MSHGIRVPTSGAAPPFTAKPGLCFTYRLAAKNRRVSRFEHTFEEIKKRNGSNRRMGLSQNNGFHTISNTFPFLWVSCISWFHKKAATIRATDYAMKSGQKNTWRPIPAPGVLCYKTSVICTGRSARRRHPRCRRYPARCRCTARASGECGRRSSRRCRADSIPSCCRR